MALWSPQYVPASTVDAQGDLLVGTAADTVARKAVGGNGDPLVGDSATSDGLRWDPTRSVDLAWLRDIQGILGGNCSGYFTADTTGMSAALRTIEFLVCKLPSGTTIGTIKFRVSTAMVGGTATIALYGSTTLGSTSWARLGSNVTITSDLQGGVGRKTITYPVSAISGDQYIRCQIVLSSTAPSTYPVFNGAPNPLALGDAAGYPMLGFSNGTTVPGATLNPSAFTDANTNIACQLTA